ncbi:MAG: cysteine desulfurase [Spirochaetia bacterium]|jgi:cysteine desulfurase/selenocysteine lyase
MAIAKVTHMGARTVEDVREDFPILDRTVHGKPLAYLDNAATSQKPRAVLDAIRVYYERGNANVHRALHALGEEATAAFEQNRGKVQRFLNARSKSEIVFTRGTTEAINLVASSWGDKFLKKGDVVLLTDMEHHSNLVPWQLLCARKGCTLAFIPLTPEGGLDLAAAEREWTDRIRMVALTHVSNVLGTVNDVKTITRLAHARGALVLVDGAQSVPHFRVDVTDIDCDFLAFSGHKMCAPMGIGILFGREQLLEQMPPWMGGGEMISAVYREKSTWNELPYKFEAGTPNVEGAIGLGAAIDYLHGLEFSAIEAWEAELARYALQRLQEVPALTLYGTAPRRGAVISFNLGSIHAHDIAQYLDKEGIAVRAGHHCAQPLMRLLDIPGTARASFSFYNTFSEINRLHDALLGAAEFYA